MTKDRFSLQIHFIHLYALLLQILYILCVPICLVHQFGFRLVEDISFNRLFELPLLHVASICIRNVVVPTHCLSSMLTDKSAVYKQKYATYIQFIQFNGAT